ncbi:MAG: hypothetical protein AAF253_07400 [Pseudomonadota bacterium]
MAPDLTHMSPMDIAERDVRRAIGHMRRWHRIGLMLAAIISFIPALLAVRYGGRSDTLTSITQGLADFVPFVNTPGEVQATLFVFGAVLLLLLTGVGAGIASDIVRSRLLARLNAHDEPVALAEAMKAHMKAQMKGRATRMAKQYRFFPKFAEAGKIQPHGVYVGIGTLVPYLILIIAFSLYFKV